MNMFILILSDKKVYSFTKNLLAFYTINFLIQNKSEKVYLIFPFKNQQKHLV